VEAPRRPRGSKNHRMPGTTNELSLRIYPDPVLRRKAAPVKEIGPETLKLAERMLEIMRDDRGIGLAAPQAGLSIRMFVVDVPPEEDGAEPATGTVSTTNGPMVFINPRLEFEGPPEKSEEGCLSLPDIRGEVLRPPVVAVRALDERGNEFTLRASGLLARCIQHETDHLDGVLIIDKMTMPSRVKNRLKIKRLESRVER